MTFRRCFVSLALVVSFTAGRAAPAFGAQLAAPSSLGAVPQSATSVGLTWVDNQNKPPEDGFDVERSLSSTSGFVVVHAAGGNATSWVNSGLVAGTYYYRVRAKRGSQVSDYSNVASVVLGGDTVAPSVPTGLSATAASCSQINLAWNAASDSGGSGLAGYRVYRNNVFLKQVATTSTSDTGLAASTTYSYQVSAIDGAGNESARSASVNRATPSCGGADTTPPSVPTGLATNPLSCSQINLSWNAASDTGGSGLAAYRVYRNSGFLKQVTATATADINLAGATTYSYQVSAVDGAGNESARSAPVNGTTPPCGGGTTTSSTTTTPTSSTTSSTSGGDQTPPSIPTGTAASAASCSQVNVSWNASSDTGGSGLRGYNVFRNGSFLRQVLAPATSTADTGLAASTAYSYRVSAVDNAGNTSALGSTATTNTPACPTGGPGLVGFVPGVGTARGVDVSAGLAVVGSDPFGLSAVNVSNPSAPTVSGASDEPFIGQHTALRGTRAVVGGQTAAGQARLWVLNVASPSDPVVQGELATVITAGNGTGFQKVVLNGAGTQAVAAMGTAGLWVINLSNPAAPSLQGALDTSGIAWGVALNAAGTVAYVADGLGGLKVVSLSNPSAPSLLGSVLPTGVNYRDVVVSGSYAFVVSQTGLLDVINVSVPTAPVRAASRTLSGFGLKIAIEGTLAAAIVGTASGDLLDVINVGTPTAPALLRTVPVGSAGSAQAVALSGGLAYIAANAEGLKIYNISLSNPSLTGAVDDFFLGQSIAVAGTKAVVVGNFLPTNTVRLKVIDVATPSAPMVRGELPTSLAPGITGVAINGAGTLAVLAVGGGGLRTVDVSNPSAPQLRGSYDTPGVAYGVALNSTGSVAYLADGLGGLKIFSVSNPSAPSLLGSLAPVGTNYRDVAVVGSFAYLANQSGTLDVFNVTTPSAPQRVASRLVSGFGLKVAADGSVVTVITGTASADQMDVLDVSNPSAPVVLRTVNIGAVGTGQGITQASGQCFVAANGLGLKIWSLASPSNPVLTSTIPTVGDAYDVAVGGGFAYVADFPATVSVIDW